MAMYTVCICVLEEMKIWRTWMEEWLWFGTQFEESVGDKSTVYILPVLIPIILPPGTHQNPPLPPTGCIVYWATMEWGWAVYGVWGQVWTGHTPSPLPTLWPIAVCTLLWQGRTNPQVLTQQTRQSLSDLFWCPNTGGRCCVLEYLLETIHY